MPHIPDSLHDAHDLELVAAYAAGDAEGAGLEQAAALVASCPECATLHHDLRAIAAAMPELQAPVRSRDFRLTPEQAASLRPGGLRGLLAAFSGPRFAFATPLGTGLAALGIVGVLVASGGFASGAGTGGASTAVRDDARTTMAAPELAPAPTAGSIYGAAEAASPAASAASAMLADPSSDASTSLSQKAAPVDVSAGAAPGDGAVNDADASTAGPGPLGVLSLVVVFIGCALLGARLVARRLARAP
jgi:hypothetical protein